MKSLLGIVITLLCFSQFAKADYWSIGSYNVLANATAEKNRLSVVTGLSIEITATTIEGVDTYRLVIEKDDYPKKQRQKIIDAGITPWTISIESIQLTSAEKASQEGAVSGMDYFLVVAGFSQEVQANLALSSFQADGIENLHIEETSIARAPWYRVLHGPFEAPFETVLSEIRGQGVTDAWWVKREPEMVREVEIATEPVRPIAMPEPVVPLVAPAIPSPPTMMRNKQIISDPSPPNPNESYLDYCIKKANALERAVYCQDGSFSGLIVAEKNNSRMDEGPKALANYCAMRASLWERRKYCTD